MNTKHFPLNLQSGSTLSKLRNFGGWGSWTPQTPLGTPLTLRNTPEERRSYLHRGGSMTLRC
jgi:hypothetical protein